MRSRHLSSFDATTFKYTFEGLPNRVGEKDCLEEIIFMDLTLLYISRVYHMVFPKCKVAWKHRVLVCPREKTSTVCPILTTRSFSSPGG